MFKIYVYCILFYKANADIVLKFSNNVPQFNLQFNHIIELFSLIKLKKRMTDL